MRRIRQHLTYSNVMVTILAFIVLTGGTAVALDGTNNVQSDDLGPGAQVKAPDVADNAVNGSDVTANSITGGDVDESSLLVSRRIARPTGGTLGAGGLTTSSATPYTLANATFTQRPNEVVEVVSELKTTLAHPSGSGANTLCQVQIDLKLDGQPLATATNPGSNADQLVTRTVAIRHGNAVLPTTTNSVQHTVTATARLVDHSSQGFTDQCSTNSQVDSFALDVIGTR